MVLPLPENIVELGVSAGGSLNGTTLAPAVAVEVAYARAFARVVPAVAALFVGGHTMSVGPGNATWRRYGLVATAASRRDWRPLWAEGRLGVALTLLDISGNSFPNNGAGVTFDPGVAFGARVGAAIASDALVAGRLHRAVAARPGGVRPGGTRYRDPAAGPGAGQPGSRV